MSSNYSESSDDEGSDELSIDDEYSWEVEGEFEADRDLCNAVKQNDTVVPS
jgi:hypothetical protein